MCAPFAISVLFLIIFLPVATAHSRPPQLANVHMLTAVVQGMAPEAEVKAGDAPVTAIEALVDGLRYVVARPGHRARMARWTILLYHSCIDDER